MKSELTHLLQKLQTDHPDFKALQIFRNGAAMVVANQSSRLFANLDALEAYAWPQASLDHDSRSEQQPLGNKLVAGLGSPPYAWNVGSSDPMAPSAQDARAASALECGDSAPLSNANTLPKIHEDQPRTIGYLETKPSI